MRAELYIRTKEIFLRHAKRKYYEDLGTADAVYKKFWKRVKPLFGY